MSEPEDGSCNTLQYVDLEIHNRRCVEVSDYERGFRDALKYLEDARDAALPNGRSKVLESAIEHLKGQLPPITKRYDPEPTGRQPILEEVGEVSFAGDFAEVELKEDILWIEGEKIYREKRDD